MNSLDDLNLHPNRTYETIVTTLNPTGRPNSATIGVRRVKDDKLQLKVFEGSNTYENLKNTESDFGVNIIVFDQYNLAIQAAVTGWGVPEPEFELSDYDYEDKIPFLRSAKGWVVCAIETRSDPEVTDDYGTTKVLDMIAKIKKIKINDKIEAPLTRSKDLPLLDAAVLATRFKVSNGDVKIKLKNKIKKFIELAIEQNPNEENNKLINLIVQFLEQYN